MNSKSIPLRMRSYLELFYFLVTKKNFMAFLLGCALVGLSFPYQPLFWFLAPLGHFFGFLYIFITSYKLSQEPKFPLSLFQILSIGLSVKTLTQLSWLLSHPYMYMYIVWFIASILLSLPLALLFRFWMTKQSTLAYPLLSGALISIYAALYESCLPSIFPGISFYSASAILTWTQYGIQFASVAGKEGLSCVIYFASLVGYRGWYLARREKSQKKAFLPLALWPLLLLFPYFYSALTLHLYNQPTPSQTIKAALCHMEEEPDVFELGQIKPWDFATSEWLKVLEVLQPLYKTQHTFDLAVIPEGAIPFPGDAYVINYEAIHKKELNLQAFLSSDAFQAYPELYTTSLDIAQALTRKTNIPFLIGLEGRDHLGGTREVFNSAYFLTPSTRRFFYDMRYDKQLLLPFGEYIPFSWMADFLKKYGIHGSFEPGKEIQIFSLSGTPNTQSHPVPFSPLICYEETFSRYGIESRKKGASIIVSLSNDCWFPCSALKWLHFDLARLHAVEIGIPFIRATNMGITGAIDPFGKPLVAFEGRELHENRLITADIHIEKHPSNTLYVSFWSLPLYIRLTLLVILCLLGLFILF